MKTKSKIKWLSEPEKQDYPAAFSYLSLIYDEGQTKLFVDKLKKTTTIQYKAKDIFRASTSAYGLFRPNCNTLSASAAMFIIYAQNYIIQSQTRFMTNLNT